MNPFVSHQKVRCGHLFTVFAATSLACAALGCSGFVSTASDTSVASAVSLHGSVHGGQQPVTGSHIYLYAVGQGGYGTAAQSLLGAQTGATLDSNGNYYVTTDSSGNFGFSTFTCPSKSATQTYLLALGGNPGYPGTSVNNTAISAIDAAGKCGSIGTSSFFDINELTTVAFVTAMQQYMTDATHVGAIGSLPNGVKVAAGLAIDLVNPAGPGTTANTTNVAGTGAIPTSKVNGIGNALAPCLNASTASDSNCTALFAAVTPTGGTRPSDIVGAMLLIAQNPGHNVGTIYGQATPSPPFQPTVNLSAVPNDLTLAITYTGGGMTAPGNVVIDALGNAYVGNAPSQNGAAGTDSIVGFGSDGTILTGSTGYTSGIHAPNALAIDQLGNIWSTDQATGSFSDEVVKLNSTGVKQFAFSDNATNGVQGIAIDASNNAWVVDQNTYKIEQVLAGGTRTLAPVSTGNFSFPTGIGIDGTGILFAAATGANTIVKFNSSGTVLATYAPGSLSQPINISIDASDHVFTINNNSSAITEINGGDGSVVTPPATQPTLSNAYVLAIDGAGGQWYANCRTCSTSNNGSPDNLVRVAVNGTQNTGTADGFQDTHLNVVGTAAIDGSGNVWVTNNGGGSSGQGTGTGSLTEFIGIAPPVVTPLAKASATNTLGTKP